MFDSLFEFLQPDLPPALPLSFLAMFKWIAYGFLSIVLLIIIASIMTACYGRSAKRQRIADERLRQGRRTASTTGQSKKVIRHRSQTSHLAHERARSNVLHYLKHASRSATAQSAPRSLAWSQHASLYQRHNSAVVSLYMRFTRPGYDDEGKKQTQQQKQKQNQQGSGASGASGGSPSSSASAFGSLESSVGSLESSVESLVSSFGSLASSFGSLASHDFLLGPFAPAAAFVSHVDFQGTGFIIDASGIIVTAAHNVLQPPDLGWEQLTDSKGNMMGFRRASLILATIGPDVFICRVVGVCGALDIAVLRVVAQTAPVPYDTSRLLTASRGSKGPETQSTGILTGTWTEMLSPKKSLDRISSDIRQSSLQHIQMRALARPVTTFPFMQFGDSRHDTHIGDECIVIGNSLGVDPSSFVSGDVRSNSYFDPTGQVIAECLLCSAPANPGNSGSPILNNQGQVIGMFTFGLPGVSGFGGGPAQAILEPVVQRILAYDKQFQAAMAVFGETGETGKIDQNINQDTGDFRMSWLHAMFVGFNPLDFQSPMDHLVTGDGTAGGVLVSQSMAQNSKGPGSRKSELKQLDWVQKMNGVRVGVLNDQLAPSAVYAELPPGSDVNVEVLRYEKESKNMRNKTIVVKTALLPHSMDYPLSGNRSVMHTKQRPTQRQQRSQAAVSSEHAHLTAQRLGPAPVT